MLGEISQRVDRSRQPAYLSNAAGPVTFVLDLCIEHEHLGSSSNPSLNGHLHYPNDIDRTLNE